MTFLEVPELLQRHGLDAGLLCLRVSASLLLFLNHGWPKLVGYKQEVQHIEDPFGIGRKPTLCLALLANAICPLAVALGWQPRLACLPIVTLMLVALIRVHRDWTAEQAQFAWLYAIVFGTLMLTGPGRWSVQA